MIFTMMAAHDTSTITLTMMGYYLARHPEWQDRLRVRVRRRWERPAIGYEDLDALPSMDLVFKETLRMNAPVGALARQAIKDTEIDGHYIPQRHQADAGHLRHPTDGAVVERTRTPSTPSASSDARREDAAHRYAWTPFGGGVHKCIGMHFGSMEVKAIMHQLLLRNSLADPGRLRAGPRLRHRAVPGRRPPDRASAAALSASRLCLSTAAQTRSRCRRRTRPPPAARTRRTSPAVVFHSCEVPVRVSTATPAAT